MMYGVGAARISCMLDAAVQHRLCSWQARAWFHCAPTINQTDVVAHAQRRSRKAKVLLRVSAKLM